MNNKHMQRVALRRDRQIGSIWGDAEKVFNDVFTDAKEKGTEIVTEHGGKVVTDAIESTDMKKVMVMVENAAGEGVKKEMTKNAPQLFALAVVGGAVGGIIFRGTFGIVGAGLLAAWAGSSLMSNLAPAPKKKK